MTLRPNLGGPSERLPQTGLVSSNATKLDIGQGGGQYSPQDRPLRRSMRLQTGRPSLPRSGRCRAKSRRLAAVDLVIEGRATSPKRRHEQSAAQEPDHKGKSNLSGTRPWSLEKLAAAANLHQNSVSRWENMAIIPTGRREPIACARIRATLELAGVEFVGRAKPGVRLCENPNYVSNPPSRARARHGVLPVSSHLAMLLARIKTLPAVVVRRKSSSPCGARTRTGAPCRRMGLGNGRCRNHGGRSTGPRTDSGRQRIASAQRERWKRWREQAGGAPP